MNTKIIKLDINKKMFETITAKQGDTKSRFILFNLYDGPIQFDLTGRTVRVYGEKKDNTTIFNDLVITDAKKGYCTLELTNQMLAVEEMYELELVIFEGEKRLSTMPFILNVIGSKYSEDAIVSTNEFTALMNALKTVQDIDNKADKKEVEKISSQLEHIKNYIYVEEYGAKGDGVTDDSLAFQNAIDYASVNNKTICLLNKTYALSHFTLKNNMSIISSEYAVLKILKSCYSSFINIDNGPITNLIYNATLKNVFISCNENNTNQVIIDCTAKKQDSYGGGVWHYTFENVRIQTLNGKQIGILLNADDSIQGVDVANQYIQFKNVNIYKNSENSYCMKIEGQLGQTKFDTCEFNGISNSVQGWLMKFEGLTSNDNGFMPVTFDNCTFQSCNKGIYAIDTHAIFNNCHVEGVTNQFIQAKGDLAHISFNNSNISGGIKPFRIEGCGTIVGKDNTWISPTGVSCTLEGIATGNYLFDLDLYMSDMYLCHETPYYEHSGITLNVGYSKSVFLDTPINDIQIIKGMFKNGDILTLTNIADTNVNIENKSFTTNSNLIWNGVNVITLKKNQTVKFVNLGENFYLVDLQRDVQSDLQIKSKDLTLSFTTGVMTTEVATGVNIDNILGFYMIYNDNVFSNPPVISLKTNGNIIGLAKTNPQTDFSVTIKLKYLG